MTAYYNENDPKAAAWLRQLIKEGWIASGDVDERSITEVRPSDLAGYTQCHFFAGIGVWSAALRGAGWPDDREVWTGSCPCQPFSASGKQSGFSDERHLWPALFDLIAQYRPAVVFGEQVASPLGLEWFDTVSLDLENEGYACGAFDLCAAGVGAPHIRQRLYFVADAADQRHERRRAGEAVGGAIEPERSRDADVVEDALGIGRRPLGYDHAEDGRRLAASTGAVDGLGDASGERREWRQGTTRRCVDDGENAGRLESRDGLVGDDKTGLGECERPGAANGFWGDADWLFCTDGKWRAVEPGTFPLAHGAAARVGRLRGYGNAIVKPLAETFIASYLDLGRAG